MAKDPSECHAEIVRRLTLIRSASSRRSRGDVTSTSTVVRLHVTPCTSPCTVGLSDFETTMRNGRVRFDDAKSRLVAERVRIQGQQSHANTAYMDRSRAIHKQRANAPVKPKRERKAHACSRCRGMSKYSTLDQTRRSAAGQAQSSSCSSPMTLLCGEGVPFPFHRAVIRSVHRALH